MRVLVVGKDATLLRLFLHRIRPVTLYIYRLTWHCLISCLHVCYPTLYSIIVMQGVGFRRFPAAIYLCRTLRTADSIRLLRS